MGGEVRVLALIGLLAGCHWADDALGQWGRDRELRGAVERAAAEVAALRGPFEVPGIRLIERDALPEELLRLTGRHPELEARYDQLETALGVRMDDEAAVELLSRSFRGYYLPADDEIVLVTPWQDDAHGMEVLRHELAHARQDQISDRLVPASADLDAFTATKLLVEGDAVLVQLAVELGPHPDALAPRLPRSGGVSGDPAERWLGHLVGRPYTRGSGVALRVFEAGGWAAIDALLVDPPAHSHTLLFPDARRDGSALEEEPYDLPEGAVAQPGFRVGAHHLEVLLATRGLLEPDSLEHWVDDHLVPWERDAERGFYWSIRLAEPSSAKALADALGGFQPWGRPAGVEVVGTDVIVRSGLR